jgi:hypothetical protein
MEAPLTQTQKPTFPKASTAEQSTDGKKPDKAANPAVNRIHPSPDRTPIRPAIENRALKFAWLPGDLELVEDDQP